MTAWWMHYKRAIPEVLCEAIIAHAMTKEAKEATVGHGSGEAKVNHDIRKSTVRWIPRNEFRPVFNELALHVLDANSRCFELTLSDYPWLNCPNAQFTEYHAEDGDARYDWHMDSTWINRGAYSRKISAVVLLSEAKDFAGGKFEFDCDVPLKDDMFCDRGDLIVFPSHIRHRVTKVTNGTRLSLVTWFNGPNLK